MVKLVHPRLKIRQFIKNKTRCFP